MIAGCEWRHAPEACGEDFGDLKKSQIDEFWRRKKKVDFGLLAEALRQVSRVVWGRWKSQHRKNVYLSPYVEKPLNSKVIKSFVPELRSRKCFFVFRDSYVIYRCALWTLLTFYVPVWIFLFHVFLFLAMLHVQLKKWKSYSNWTLNWRWSMRNDIGHFPPSRDALKRQTITSSTSPPGSCRSILTRTEQGSAQDNR